MEFEKGLLGLLVFMREEVTRIRFEVIMVVTVKIAVF
jgi:hypothetical protein